MLARRVVAGALIALLVCAAGLASAHGHFDTAHPQTCATCTLVSARAQITPAPSMPPVCSIGVELPAATPPVARPHTRPPLELAPKHGPPFSL